MAGRHENDIGRLYASGMTLEAIGRQCGDTISGVRKTLIRLGMKRRPRGHQVSLAPPD